MVVPPQPPSSPLLSHPLLETNLSQKTAIFNLQSLLLVILLLICTSTYIHAIVPSIMDRNKDGYVNALRPFCFYDSSACAMEKHISVFTSSTQVVSSSNLFVLQQHPPLPYRRTLISSHAASLHNPLTNRQPARNLLEIRSDRGTPLPLRQHLLHRHGRLRFYGLAQASLRLDTFDCASSFQRAA
jgi:Protein of unknown function (DUF1242)